VLEIVAAVVGYPPQNLRLLKRVSSYADSTWIPHQRRGGPRKTVQVLSDHSANASRKGMNDHLIASRYELACVRRQFPDMDAVLVLGTYRHMHCLCGVKSAPGLDTQGLG
jgi:hypothetical protein